MSPSVVLVACTQETFNFRKNNFNKEAITGCQRLTFLLRIQNTGVNPGVPTARRRTRVSSSWLQPNNRPFLPAYACPALQWRKSAMDAVRRSEPSSHVRLSCDGFKWACDSAFKFLGFSLQKQTYQFISGTTPAAPHQAPGSEE